MLNCRIAYAKKKWKYTTYDTNMGAIRNHLYPTFGEMKLRKITPFAVEKFFSEITAKKISSPNTQISEEDLRCISGRIANYIYSLFNCIMSKVVKWKELTESPVICDKPAPDYESEQREAWAPEEFDLVLANIEHELLHLAVHFAFKTSMRIGEIVGLTWDCIDYEQCSVLVNKQVQRVSRESLKSLSKKFVIHELPSECIHSKKKGKEKDTVVILKSLPKNSHSRTVLISKALLDELLRRKEVVDKNKAFYGEKYMDDQGLVFCFEDGRPIEPKRASRWFEHWQKNQGAAFGLNRVVFHSIRSTSTSYKLTLSGGDIKAVQNDTGHKTSQMVTEVYSRTFLNRKQDLSNKFDEDFYGAKPEQPLSKKVLPPAQMITEVTPQPDDHNRDALVALLANDPHMLKNLLSAVFADKA